MGRRSAAHAAAATAAVSTRSTRGPSVVGRQPAATASATSSAVSPPSGPTATATPARTSSTGGDSPPSVCSTSRAAGNPADRTNSPHFAGGSTAISTFRPHCLLASITARRNFSTVDSFGTTTDRAVTSGTNRVAPSSVSFSMRKSARSPFGSADATTNSNPNSRLASTAGDTASATDRLPTETTSAGYSRPSPLNRVMRSPGPNRRTAARWCASGPSRTNSPGASGCGV